MKPTLEPLGVHPSPSGMVRYAIWGWTDADGPQRIPCAVIDRLDRTPAPAADATCATPRQKAAFRDKGADHTLRRIMLRDGLIDDDGRLTEKGAVVRFHFQRRPLVQAGAETPHGLRRRALECAAF